MSVLLVALVAVPDLLLAALLPAFDTRSSGNLFWIAGRSLLHISALVFRNLGQRASREDRGGSDFGHLFLGGVIVAVLDQKPLPIPRSYQHPRALELLTVKGKL